MKGVINENIIDMLNIRPLDEVLKENGVDVEATAPPAADDAQPTIAALHALSAKLTAIDGSDHSEAMDDLHSEILQHARDLMAYGFNVDHPRARGIFEVAAMFYNHAIATKNSKRDAQLKTMKLAIDRKRFELDEKRANGGASLLADSDNTILVEDRNELLRRIRQKVADATPAPPQQPDGADR